jgi:hypothetical protein
MGLGDAGEHGVVEPQRARKRRVGDDGDRALGAEPADVSWLVARMWELDPGAGIITAGSASVASEAWHTHLAISSFRRNGCSSTCNVAQRGGA